MKYIIAFALVLILSIGGLVYFHHDARPTAAAGTSLTLYCAAGVSKPIEAVAAEFRREFGIALNIQTGGSGQLLSNIKIARPGDLYISADAATMAEARKSGVVREVIPIAVQRPVIAVKKGNPKAIHSMDDLLKPGIRFALANQTASIGMVTKKAVGDRWEEFSSRVAVTKTTVTDIASDVNLGAVDAAVVWDSTVPQFAALEAVALPEMEKYAEPVSIGVLSSCQQPAVALRFARYLAAPQKGGAELSRNGFKASPGDTWADKPKLLFYSGSVNRPALEATLREFADREGIDISTVFNGCGILCASMKSMAKTPGAQIPDAYFACDVCFIPPVADLYPKAVILTETDIGIAVLKGNPRGIHSIADLGKPDLKIGICNAEQATLGYLTKGLLKSSGHYEDVMKNVASQVPTADLLINQLRTGSLDAAIVYATNARPAQDHIDLVKIDDSGAKAMQPFAVAEHSPNAQLANRLLEFLRAHQTRFEDAGFRWRGNEAPITSRDIQIPSWLKSANE